MNTHAFTPIRAALIALCVLAAPQAHASMYKWVGEDGAITYSNKLPDDPAKVRQVTRIETPSPAAAKPAPTRTAQVDNADPLFAFVPTPRAAQAPQPQSTQAQPEVVITPAEIPAARAELPPRRAYHGAAQDPCLRSSDPKCYERNKDQYHPFLGYAPATATAVGSTVSTAGGAVAGGSTR